MLSGEEGAILTSQPSAIFGLEFRDRLTLESDITVSSMFGLDGTADSNDPDVDPTGQTQENIPIMW